MTGPRPLRPLALGWAAFGILPYLAAALLLGEVPALTFGLLGAEVGALVTVILVVRSRVPVPYRRVATVAAFSTFAFACLRFGVLPFVGGDAAGGTMKSAADLAVLRHLLAADALVDGAFGLACLVLAVTCTHALWRARSTSGPGPAS